MRGAIGPILTTGVALAAAGVVVANPIVAPRADVQIPAVELSAGSGDPTGMLDQAFLDAIAPSPPESMNPFSVLRQLITSLAADATHLGKNAIVDAFVAGVTAVSQPELTALSTPYYPSLADSPELAASVLPGLDLDSLAPLADLGAEVAGPVTMLADSVPPVVQTLVAGVVTDVGFVGGELIVAAFAAGAVVAAEPGLIGDTLEALLTGDLSGALQNAVKVVTAPLGPPVIVLNALRSVFEKNIGAAAAALASAVPALSATTGQPVVAAVVPPAPETPAAGVSAAVSPPVAEAPSGDAHERTARGPVQVAFEGPIDPTGSAEGSEAVEPESTPAITAADTRTQTGEVVESESTPGADSGIGTDGTSPAPRSPLRDAVSAVQQHVGEALTALGGSAGVGPGATAGSGTEGGSRARAGKSSGKSATSGR